MTPSIALATVGVVCIVTATIMSTDIVSYLLAAGIAAIVISAEMDKED